MLSGLEFPDFPMLLGRHVKVPTAQRARSSEAEVEESCAHAARKAFLEQQERVERVTFKIPRRITRERWSFLELKHLGFENFAHLGIFLVSRCGWPLLRFL